MNIYPSTCCHACHTNCELWFSMFYVRNKRRFHRKVLSVFRSLDGYRVGGGFVDFSYVCEFDKWLTTLNDPIVWWWWVKTYGQSIAFSTKQQNAACLSANYFGRTSGSVVQNTHFEFFIEFGSERRGVCVCVCVWVMCALLISCPGLGHN